MKLFEMFSGYGGASFALKKAGIDFECVGFSEIDKYALQCYEQNHKGENFGDCTKIDPNDIPDFDLLTGGFPCQSFSVAGKGLGYNDTRGTLFHEIIRIAEVKKPKYMLLENVKGLTFKPHRETFAKILSELTRIGYWVKWKVLNTKEHGIPQNRERIFFFCFRNKEEWKNFKLPTKIPLKIFLKDILEKEVEEKYYLSEKQIIKLKEYLGKKNKINAEVMNCVGTCFGRSDSSSEECESYARTNQALMLGNLSRYKMKSERTIKFKEDGISWNLTGNSDVGVVDIYRVNKTDQSKPIYIQIDKGHHSQQDRYYFTKFCSPTMVQNVPSILDIYNNKIKKGIVPTLTEPHHNNLRLISSTQSHNSIREDGISNCLPSARGKGGGHTPMIMNHRIRKLTPKECFRLMGFLDDNINLDGLSNTQRYKLAGNGWDINLVSKIFKEMFK